MNTENFNYKNFYKQLGRLLYSIAASDGMVRKQEKISMKEFVFKTLSHHESHNDSSGMNEAFYTMFEFDNMESENMDAVILFEDFISYYKKNESNIDEELKAFCIYAAMNISSAFKNINKKEEKMLERLLKEVFQNEDSEKVKEYKTTISKSSNTRAYMKTILVPTDFSDNAEKAMHYAFELAKHYKSKIILLNAWDLPHQKSTMFLSIKNVLQEKAEQEINAVKDLMLNKYPEVVTESITMMGNPIYCIKKAAKIKAADMIIMGTRGATGLKKIFLGSNAAGVIEGAPCPVLVIPEKAKFKNIKSIAFATDFNTDDFLAINSLIPIAKIFGAEIIVTHIADSESNEEDLFKKFSENAERKIKYERLKFMSFAGENVQESLNKFIDSANIGLIAMSTKKRGFLEGLFSKSMTKEMIYSSSIPVIAFQATANAIELELEDDELKPLVNS
jgi:nucleotide-binding universal stress UspA family protein